MIAPTRDPAILNYFANHPDIAMDLDLTGAIRETAVFLFGDHGGFLFEWSAPDTYEVHVMITKAGRGAWGFAAALEARAMLGASRIWARVAPDAKALAYFTRKAGFREIETRTLYAGDQPAVWRIFEWRKECPLQS